MAERGHSFVDRLCQISHSEVRRLFSAAWCGEASCTKREGRSFQRADTAPCFTGSYIYLDADMLALKPIGFVFALLESSRSFSGTWKLHGSTTDVLASRKAQFNAGFFAFTTPVDPDFARRILKLALENAAEVVSPQRCIFEVSLSPHALVCSTQHRENGQRSELPGDQRLLSMALHESKALHTDWRTNYRPVGKDDLEAWRVVHWNGAVKPWGPPPATAHMLGTHPLKIKQNVTFESEAVWEGFNAMWQVAYAHVLRRCGGPGHGPVRSINQNAHGT